MEERFVPLSNEVADERVRDESERLREGEFSDEAGSLGIAETVAGRLECGGSSGEVVACEVGLQPPEEALTLSHGRARVRVTRS